ncbi:MAG: 6-bladed beta-propeller [Planctomycetes bacterium]|nr:6-bladed beta-propeller [Planctomycetota bacterium]
MRRISCWRRAIRAAFLFLAAVPWGCAELEPIFPPRDPPLVWPSGGDPARFAYIGAIGGEADLKRPRSFWSRLLGLVAGIEPPAALRSAHGVAVSGSRILYVSDPDARCVHRFDLERREYRALTDAAGNGRKFVMPIGLALAGEKLLVADRSLHAVAVLSPEGEPEAFFGEESLQGPVGVAVGPSGRLYVADVEAHQVKAFDGGGKNLFIFGGRGRAPGKFNYPTHVACDAEGNILVSDSLNCRIQVFDQEGRFLRSWGQRGDTPGDFSQPKGIACDRRGQIYVVDSHFENVQVFSPQGELLLAFGQEGKGPGEFWLPVGIFVNGNDTIWVCDSFNHRVQAFRYLEEQVQGFP